MNMKQEKEKRQMTVRELIAELVTLPLDKPVTVRDYAANNGYGHDCLVESLLVHEANDLHVTLLMESHPCICPNCGQD